MKPSWTLLPDIHDAPKRNWEEVQADRDAYLKEKLGDELMSQLSRIELENDLRSIAIERFRCPLKLELWRHVVPLVLAVAMVCLSLGYAWRMAQ